MHGEVHPRCQGLAVRRIEVEHGHCRIDSGHGARKVGAARIGIHHHSAVLHQKAPVETHVFLASEPPPRSRRLQVREGQTDGFGHLTRQLRTVLLAHARRLAANQVQEQ